MVDRDAACTPDRCAHGNFCCPNGCKDTLELDEPTAAFVREVFDLVTESNRRCHELRAALVRGTVLWGDALPEYAKATAPLAKAAKLIEEADNADA